MSGGTGIAPDHHGRARSCELILGVHIMEDDSKIGAAADAVGQKTRRAFVKTAAHVAVTAPAVAMLLSASTKPAAAATFYALGDDFQAANDAPNLTNHTFDDFISLGDDFVP